MIFWLSKMIYAIKWSGISSSIVALGTSGVGANMFEDVWLLMVQKSGVHQLRLVVYPII